MQHKTIWWGDDCYTTDVLGNYTNTG